ncbi:MAG: YidC/Oxa1 family membrane protein insertase [Termitinemataceae bacterium]|nr:MAG: YidC/Oxa1 family membrane protein insertase [Termitinemataceae bacterium]
MLDFLYTLIIFPLVQIIEIVYIFSEKVFKSEFTAIGFISLLISVCTLPLYFMAEKKQDLERDIQAKLKPGIDRIKKTFSGDTRFMILQTFYRQNNYHPMYALRSSLSLLIQIPFFIAAYTFLSHLSDLQGASFYFIKNLGLPDALLNIGGTTINILPLLMTAINCTSGAIYTKDLRPKDKLQVYGMAAIFLVLLYNSPSALVLYWLMNNLFSLAKNILQQTKHPARIAYIALFILVIAIDYYIIFIRGGPINRRLAIFICATFLLFIPFALRALKIIFNRFGTESTALECKRTFICSTATLFLLAGLIIPTALIASSTEEFSFIAPYTTPFPFIGTTLMQSAGIFIFYSLVIYFMFPKRTKIALTMIFVILSITALVNTFIFLGNYGFLTATLTFSNASVLSSEYLSAVINALVTGAIIFLCFFILFSKHKKIIFQAQIIIIIALVSLGTVNTFKIKNTFEQHAKNQSTDFSDSSIDKNILSPVYHFSKNGKNVVIIMLDRAISGYVPYIFEEKPNLQESFRDFTFYPNTVSLGGYTLLGVPSLFGGYDYSPQEMQRRSEELLVKKYNEALLVLPRLFSENGYSVTVTNPTYANFSSVPDLKIYNNYPNVHAANLFGRYSAMWLRNHPDVDLLSVSSLLKHSLIVFSFFKMSPVVLRSILYYNGTWIASDNFENTGIEKITIDNYAELDTLSAISIVEDSDANTYTALSNDLTHEPAFFQAPDYVPVNNLTDKGPSLYADETHYHANMAALLMLARWFDYFKEQNIYDNTRIIIVSDHGWDFNTKLKTKFDLPGSQSMINFNPILLVKDFKDVREENSSRSNSSINIDNSFMSHADVPFLASKGLVNPVNPWTGKSFEHDKTDGITISTVHSWGSPNRKKYKWEIRDDQWLHVKDNIFDAKNWTKAAEMQ